MTKYGILWRLCVGGLLLVVGFLKIGDLGPLQKVLLWDGAHPKYIGLATWVVTLSEIAVGALLISVGRPQVIIIALMLFACYTSQLIALVRHPEAAPSCACMASLAAKIQSNNAGNVMALWRNIFIIGTGMLALKQVVKGGTVNYLSESPLLVVR